MQISLAPANNFYNNQNTTNIQFGGIKFYNAEKKSQQIELLNPYNNTICKLPNNIDLSQEQEIRIKSNKTQDFTMYYDPDRIDYLRDKTDKKEKEVCVLWSENPENSNEFTYHFFSKDLKHNYGYFMLSEYKTAETEGVEEICVKTLDKNITNLYELADKYAVQYCKRNNIKPNVISYPNPEEYREHYKAGKRFIPPQKNSEQYKFLNKKYYNSDPNEILKKENINVSTLPSMKMVLPEERKNYYYNNLILDGFSIENYINNKEEDFEIYDSIDTTIPHDFKYETKFKDTFSIEFDPKKNGIVYDKKTGKPIDVFILKSHDTADNNIDVFHFYSKDLKHEYGHVEIDRDYKSYNYEMYQNYSKPKILGKRIVIGWLENKDDKNIGGIGRLADKAEVKYCMENNIPPQIISYAGDNSHIAHYKRGKRFIKPEKDSAEYNFLMNTYGSPNPNSILRKLAQQSKTTGQKIDLSEWNKYDFLMYLPEHLVEKYKKEN